MDDTGNAETNYSIDMLGHIRRQLDTLSLNWTETPFTEFAYSDRDRALSFLCERGAIEMQVDLECWNPIDLDFPRYYMKAIISGKDWEEAIEKEVMRAVFGTGNSGSSLNIQPKPETYQSKLTIPLGLGVQLAARNNRPEAFLSNLRVYYSGRAGISVDRMEEPARKAQEEQLEAARKKRSHSPEVKEKSKQLHYELLKEFPSALSRSREISERLKKNGYNVNFEAIRKWIRTWESLGY